MEWPYNVKDRYCNSDINNCFHCDHSPFLHFLNSFPWALGQMDPWVD